MKNPIESFLPKTPYPASVDPAAFVRPRLRSCILLAAALFSLQPCHGQIGIPEADAERTAAPVKLDGTVLLRVRGVASITAEQRAQTIAARIEAAAGDISMSPEALRVGESSAWSTIVAGDRVLMAVTDLDASLEGSDRKTLAEKYRVTIAEAIDAYRRERRAGLLLKAALYALGATLALLALLFAGNRLFRTCHAALERSFRSKVHNDRSGSLPLMQADLLWSPMSALLRLLRTITVLPIGFVYAGFVLGLFPWTRQTSRNLLAILLGPLHTIGQSFVASLPSLLFLVVFAVIVRYALKLIMLLFEAIANGAVSFAGFDTEWAMPTYRMVRVLVVAFALVVAYPYMPGSDSGAFKGLSLFLGVVLSLSSSSAIANVIAGYTLIYRRAYRVGDRVKIGDSFGDVDEIRLQATFVRSLKNEIIVIPNSEVLKTSVINYSAIAKGPGLILHTSVGIGYETPWRLVEAMLLEAAQRTPQLLRDPPPFVLQTFLGDFAITYEINAFCNEPRATDAIYTALHRNILDTFNEHGVQIMTPAYIADPTEPKLVPRDLQLHNPVASALPRTADFSGN
jgi:small-conductance mechanosensitive channel